MRFWYTGWHRSGIVETHNHLKIRPTGLDTPSLWDATLPYLPVSSSMAVGYLIDFGTGAMGGREIPKASRALQLLIVGLGARQSLRRSVC